MKFIVCAGTPGSGKTSILLHTIKELKLRDLYPSVVKVDCLQTDDDRRYKRAGVPIKVGISADMCPDHFSIFGISDVIAWAIQNSADSLIMETAGLCLRCAPYTDKCLAVCVIDITTGPNTPLKIGPMLTTANVVVMTKGDLVSQAEREVFREKIHEVNPHCKIVEANGLSGKGAAELADLICVSKDITETTMVLRHTPPLAICTLCTGEKRVHKKFHCGVLRHFNGLEEYLGE